MPISSLFRHLNSGEVIQDCDLAKVEAAKLVLLEAGISSTEVSDMLGRVSVYSCFDCKQAFLNKRLISFPGWCEQNTGKGRKVEVKEITSLLGESGWNSELRCEACMLEHAPRFAAIINNLDNKNLRRFLRVFAARVNYALTYSTRPGTAPEDFKDSPSYRFYVAFVAALFKLVPAKNRVAFKDLTAVMAKLDLL